MRSLLPALVVGGMIPNDSDSFVACTNVVSRGRARLVVGGMTPNDSDSFVRASNRRQASDEEESFIFNSRSSLHRSRQRAGSGTVGSGSDSDSAGSSCCYMYAAAPVAWVG